MAWPHDLPQQIADDMREAARLRGSPTVDTRAPALERAVSLGRARRRLVGYVVTGREVVREGPVGLSREAAADVLAEALAGKPMDGPLHVVVPRVVGYLYAGEHVLVRLGLAEGGDVPVTLGDVASEAVVRRVVHVADAAAMSRSIGESLPYAIEARDWRGAVLAVLGEEVRVDRADEVRAVLRARGVREETVRSVARGTAKGGGA